MPDIQLRGVNKVYANGVHAVRDLDLEVELGEFLVLVGPSGCGKTTALRMIAGLESISSGEIEIGDRVVNDVSARDRDIAMVFQTYALYPHMTVRQNIAYGLRMRKLPRAEIAERVARAARMLDLEELLERRPKQLSGGQRQRVAMGRAIVREPRVFLMDEPLSNLDARLRVQMRADIAQLQKQLGVTAIYVTHDQVEAMTMGDRVAVMRDGELQQVAPPQRLYDSPENLFVAAFIGSPPMNLAIAELVPGAAGVELRLGNDTISLSDAILAQRPGLRTLVGRSVAVGIRPEDLAPAENGNAGSLRSRIELTEALGSALLAHFAVGAAQPDITGATIERQFGHEVQATRWVASLRPRAGVAVGDVVELAVDPERLHFFGLDDGRAIRDA